MNKIYIPSTNYEYSNNIVFGYYTNRKNAIDAICRHYKNTFIGNFKSGIKNVPVINYTIQIEELDTLASNREFMYVVFGDESCKYKATSLFDTSLVEQLDKIVKVTLERLNNA